MIRPTLEVADIIRAQGEHFIERSQSWLTWAQRKVLYAIARCRTAALGGHRDRCARCGHRAISYNSCRNRHCPKCQTGARNRWLAERSKELLPVRYVHVVFTLPHQLAPLAYQNKRLLYRLLFQASAATLLEVAATPQHLGAHIGFLSVLHTWGQNLQHHPHVHCVIPAGGLSADHTALDSAPVSFLSTGEGSQSRLSRQVCGGPATGLPTGETRILRRSKVPPRSEAIPRPGSFPLPPGLDRLRQAALRRSPICSALPGPLHPSRRYFQPSSGLPPKRPGQLSAGRTTPMAASSAS